MKIVEMLKNRNRTLLEVDTAILFWTAAATLAGWVLPFPIGEVGRLDWFVGVWMAAALSVIAMLHMHRCLDRALDYDESTATKLIFRGYLIRYVAFAVILAATTLAGLINPVILCLGYLLLMKVAVYSQPFTHKLYNKLFHETDPQPEPIEEELHA